MLGPKFYSTPLNFRPDNLPLVSVPPLVHNYDLSYQLYCDVPGSPCLSKKADQMYGSNAFELVNFPVRMLMLST